jgi:hypothetical protein
MTLHVALARVAEFAAMGDIVRERNRTPRRRELQSMTLHCAVSWHAAPQPLPLLHNQFRGVATDWRRSTRGA